MNDWLFQLGLLLALSGVFLTQCEHDREIDDLQQTLTEIQEQLPNPTRENGFIDN